MSLPHFQPNANAHNLSDPVFKTMFEISCATIDKEILEEITSYNLSTKEQELKITFNINEDTFRNFKRESLETNRIDIYLHNKKGEIIKKIFLYDMQHLGFEIEGDYINSTELVNLKAFWSFKKYETIDLKDLD